MTMSPQEIQTKQFHVRFRGFDVEEVDGFLEQVAEHYMMVIEEKKTLSATVDSLQAELDSLKNEEHSFKNAIISAQRVADEMLRKSEDQANSLLAKAQDECEELKEAAHKEITELEYRVDELRGLQSKLHDDLRQVIGQYVEQMEQTFTASQSETVSDESSETVGLEDLEIVSASDDAETAPDEEAASVENTSEIEAAEPDLGDLYETIDLGSDGGALLDGDSLSGDIGSIELEEAGATGALIPDLDDEVMFTLEDPLDVEDVDVSISMFEDNDKPKD